MNGFTISLIFTGVFLIITILGVINGITRGVGRQTMRTITIITSLFSSLLTTMATSSTLNKLCAGKSLGEFLMSLDLHRGISNETMDILFCFDAETAEQLLAIPFYVILLPFVFLGIFIAITLFTFIVYLTLCRLFCAPGGRMSKLSRALGGVLGAVHGIVVATVVLLPFVNMVDIAAGANDKFIEKYDGAVGEIAFCEIYDEYIDDVNDNPIVRAVNAVAARPICNAFATIKVDGKNVDLRDTAAMLIVAADDFSALKEYDWTDPTPEECDELRRIITSVSDDTYVSGVLSGTLRGIATAIERDVFTLEFEEPALGVMEGIVQIFTTLDADSFSLDIRTILDVYELLAKENILPALTTGDADQVSGALVKKDSDGKTVIVRIVDTIRGNEHMKPLVTLFTKLSLSIMMDNVGVDNGAEIYESVKDGLTTVIAIDKDAYATDEEYRAAISSALETTLNAHDIDLHPDIVDGMADYVAENLSEVDEVSDDIIYDTIFSYYDAYSEHIGEADILP